MKSLLAILLLATGGPILTVQAVAGPCADSVFLVNATSLWYRIAEADLVVVGTIISPREEQSTMLQKDTVPVRVVKWLKGEIPVPSLPVSNLEWQQISCSSTNIFFLGADYRPQGGVRETWTFGPCIQATTQAILDIKTEVAVQVVQMDDPIPGILPNELPFWNDVSNLISHLSLDETNQAASVSGLLSLGKEACAAIILNMGEDKLLPEAGVVFSNRSGYWEQERYYAVQTTTDLLDVLLGHQIGIGLESLFLGGSPKSRENAVQRWRVFLYHWNRARSENGLFPKPALLVPGANEESDPCIDGK